jgi:hypothetical protein
VIRLNVSVVSTSYFEADELTADHDIERDAYNQRELCCMRVSSI